MICDVGWGGGIGETENGVEGERIAGWDNYRVGTVYLPTYLV